MKKFLNLNRSLKLAIVLFFISSFCLIARNIGTVSYSVNLLNDDTNWNLQLNFYDYDDTEKLIKELSWDAKTLNEIKNVVLQINYKNEKVMNEYAPGDLTITISNIAYYNGSYVELIDSTTGDETSEYEWKLVSTGENIVLTNNVAIEDSTNLEGTIQLAFRPDVQKLVSGGNYTYSASLGCGDNIYATTDDIKLNFTSSIYKYSFTTTSNKLSGYDGLPNDAEDYIWVKYQLNFSRNDDSGIREFYLGTYRWGYSRDYPTDENLRNSFYFLQKVPEDAVVLDLDMNVLKNDGGKVKITSWRSLWAKMYTYVIVGYPKEKYENSKISVTSEVHGIYWDETEESVLGSSTSTINMDDFTFEYTGVGDGGIYKTSSRSQRVSYLQAQNNGANAYYHFQLTYNWGGVKEDIEVGDDYVYATNENNDYVKLTSDEYKFTEVAWNGSKLFNANEAHIKAYDLELWVKYDDKGDYVQYGDTLVANVDNTITFDSDKNVTSYKWIIRDVQESIKADPNSTLSQYWGYDVTMECNVKVKKDDLLIGGYVFNFAYIKIYQGDEWINKKELANYSEGITRDVIAKLDYDVHGDYLSRVVAKEQVLDNSIIMRITEKNENQGLLANNVEKGYFTGTYNVSTYIDFMYGNTENFEGMTYYSLLPAGMDFEGLGSIEKASTIFKNNVKTKSGVDVDDDYLSSHLKVKSQANYRNSGRTLVTITWDFTDDPLNFSGGKFDNGEVSALYFPKFYLNVTVSYESYLEFGANYTNVIYMEPINRNNLDYIALVCIDDYNGYVHTLTNNIYKSYSRVDTDNLNNSGTDDVMYYSESSLSILDLVSSYQDVLILAQTNQNNYSVNEVTTSVDTDYSYKLRIRPGNNDITNLIVYNNIETAFGDNDYWNGMFNGVDTTYAEKQGYYVKVWYSEKSNAGSLSNDDSWMEYNDGVTDNSKVKSVAFQYLNEDGTAAYLPKKTYTYVVIKMKSLNVDSLNSTYNNCWTEWNAYDDGVLVKNVTGIISNTVVVKLPGTNVSDNGVKGEDIEVPETTTGNVLLLIMMLGSLGYIIFYYKKNGSLLKEC